MMFLLRPTGQPIVGEVKAVRVEDTQWVSFVLANGGLNVTPGEVYGIELEGTPRFGWKYAAKGYRRGEALFNGKPLLKGAHSSFLFKTFGD